MDPKGVPRGQAQLLHFIKCVISRKPFRSPPITIYIRVPLDKAHLVTWILGPLGVSRVHAPPPSFHKMLNSFETVEIPNYEPYIFLFLMMRHIQWHGLWIPKGSPGGMPHPLHFIKCVISRKLFRSPPINYIYFCSLWQAAFNNMDPRVPRGHASPAIFIKCIISWKPFRSPPINHIYSCFD